MMKTDLIGIVGNAFRLLLAGLGLAAGSAVMPAMAPAAPVPAEVRAALARGEPQELIVLLDDTAVEGEVAGLSLPAATGAREAAQRRLALKVQRYGELKERLVSALAGEKLAVVRAYSHLPLFCVRLGATQALERLAARREVKGIYPNEARQPALAESLPLIGQPAAAWAGFTGAGTAVAVLDTGVDYTREAFGYCTAPGVPASCKVIVSFDTAPEDYLRDDAILHGTNVAGIVLGVAPESRIIAIDVFTNDLAYDADILEAANWLLVNQSTYNIVAANLSFGSGYYTAPCGDSPYAAVVYQARAAGIIPVAASGNEGHLDGMLLPACVPGVVSVGAVYDSYYGTFHGTICTETAAPDKVACFSNSASFLTMLAPGSIITAAGVSMSGTSQAAPHVAGGVAVLRSAFPAETPDATQTRLTASGTPVTDLRNGLVKPRLSVAASLGSPANDAFADGIPLTGVSGQAAGVNLNATSEAGEPEHAGVAGGASVWWTWQAPAEGTVTLDTHGSNFDTLLGVYTGVSVNALTPVAANDNDGSAYGASGLTFPAHSGELYRLAVDGRAGATGRIDLTWSFIPAAQADLAITASGEPPTLFVGQLLSYTVTVGNYGPAAATDVTVTSPLPAGAAFVSASPGCGYAAGTVSCNAGPLAVGGSISFGIVVTPTAAGTLLTMFQTGGSTNDPAPGNNTTVVYTPVGELLYPVLVDNVQYPTLTNGFGVVTDGGAILATASLFTEELLLNRAVRCTLRGGYDSLFSAQSGYTTVQGTLTLAAGALTVDRLVIR
ncbi:serine protease [Geotalea uraniireducens]|uniref:Serine protease n=1 Tax=Geotalea uraniireducens TaxID=351604 RepID=A0ABM8EJS7_9BACT|nr:S8 family serine peptidase [Geotalea uraniireducens]BDV42272.1 serine protease [Geotalea uraniireducens]